MMAVQPFKIILLLNELCTFTSCARIYGAVCGAEITHSLLYLIEQTMRERERKSESDTNSSTQRWLAVNLAKITNLC